MSLNKRSIELGTEGWGVKEDNLLAFRKDRTRYVEKPFDFSRASEGTIINSDGYIQYSGFGNELITNGDFEQGQTGWTNSDGSLTFGNGYVKITSNGTTVNRLRQTGENLVGGAGINAGLYRLTYDIIENNNVTDLRVFDGSAYVVIPSTVGSQQFIIDHDGINNNFFINLRDSNTGNYVVIDNVSLKKVEQETPRISYDIVDGVVSSDKHLLLEPARTNLITYSENFSTWSKQNFTLNSDTTIAPDGSTVNGYDFGDGYIYADTANLDGVSQYTNSIYIKANKEATIGLRKGGHGSGSTNDNIILTTEWVRYTSTSAAVTTNNGRLLLDNRAANGYGESDLKVFIFGAQLEQGSYASSYIPTYGTIETRAAETANNCGAVQDFNDDEGVLYAEISTSWSDPISGVRALAINDGGQNNSVNIYFANNNTLRTRVYSGGALQAEIIGDYDNNRFYRVATSYKANEVKFFINGNLVGTDTSATMPVGLSKLNDFRTDASTRFAGRVKELKVYTEELNDAELRLLTKYAPKDYDAAFTADYVDSLAEFTVLRTEATDKLYYVISDGANSVSGSATITATQVTISNIDISSLNDGALTLSVYIEDETRQRGVTVTDTTIKDTVNTPLYSYALQQRATGAIIEELDNAEAIIESLNVEV